MWILRVICLEKKRPWKGRFEGAKEIIVLIRNDLNQLAGLAGICAAMRTNRMIGHSVPVGLDERFDILRPTHAGVSMPRKQIHITEV